MLFELGWSKYRYNINPLWNILDVGSGHNPFLAASVHLELYLEGHGHGERHGNLVSVPNLVCGDIEHAPFNDSQFDFCYINHVAEHVLHPHLFCSEVCRICKSGYIETPSHLGEALLGDPAHKWLVSFKNSTLLFHSKTIHMPYGYTFELLWKRGDKISSDLKRIAWLNPGLIWTQFLFTGPFKCEVYK